MSLLEKSARNTVAASLLNKMRHWLQGRQPDGLSSDERQVLSESLGILESKQFDQMIIHSFRGIENPLNASVLSVSMALRNASEQGDCSLKKLLDSNQLPEDQAERDNYINLLSRAIQAIGDFEVGLNSRSQKMPYKGL
jgi:hypothetical protein